MLTPEVIQLFVGNTQLSEGQAAMPIHWSPPPPSIARASNLTFGRGIVVAFDDLYLCILSIY